MSVYNVALFIHFLGLIALFAGFAIYQRAGMRLRSANVLVEARIWLDLLMTTRGMFLGGSVMLLLTGLVMAWIRWREPIPWMTVAIVGLIAISMLAFIANRGLRPFARPTALHVRVSDPVPSDLTRAIEERSQWIMMGAANGMALAIVWLMITKPGWLMSISILLALALLGAAMAARLTRRSE